MNRDVAKKNKDVVNGKNSVSIKFVERLDPFSSSIPGNDIFDVYRNINNKSNDNVQNTQKKDLEKRVEDLLQVIEKQNERISCLEKEVSELKVRHTTETKEEQQKTEITQTSRPRRRSHGRILGFNVCKNKSISVKNGKKYTYEIFYGFKKIDGRQKKVYIGKDLSKAKDKIKSWCEKNKHPLGLDTNEIKALRKIMV